MSQATHTGASSSAPPASKSNRISGVGWLLALIPLLLLGVLLTYVVVTGGGLGDLSGPPVEQIAIQRITLPEPGMIRVEVVNDGPMEVTIPQVLVDDAYWSFSAEPSNTLPRFGHATFMIPYPWVEEEAHVVRLITSLGATFDGEISAAVESPEFDSGLSLRYGLIGVYVGIVPVLLGMLWYPFLRRLSRQAMNFVLALTVGLLLYLAVSTWLDALEFAAELPAFWQGVPLVTLVALITLGLLMVVGSRSRRTERSPLAVAYLIALGIGLHNLGEGLAIGASFSLGEAALGTFLILGFTLHNITEGIGIAAPIVRDRPHYYHFALLVLLAGGPAVLGMWFGGFAFNPVFATIFLAIGVGAILQVVWEVGKIIVRDRAADDMPALNWVTLSGVVAGVAVMYVTAFLTNF